MDEHEVTPDTVRAALQEAISKVEGQTQTALADKIGAGVKTGHIFYWLKSGSVPEKHAAAIELATGVSRKRFCADWARVWPEIASQQEAA